MAKDGTYRGGRRVRAGAKPDALVDKLKKGHVAEILEPPVTELTPDGLPAPPDLVGEEMPEPGAYLSAVQRDGKPLGADIIYAETWAWLKARKCERLINKRLLESYAMAFARYVQCEEAATHYGLLGKHPTTGGAITSPFVTMAQSFQKQANLLWSEIFEVVKQNSLTPYEGMPQDDAMERLLRARRG